MCITSAQFLSLNLSFLFNLFYTLLLVSGHRDYYWIPRLLLFFGFKESATIIPSPLLLFFVIFWESATIIPTQLLFDTREYITPATPLYQAYHPAWVEKGRPPTQGQRSRTLEALRQSAHLKPELTNLYQFMQYKVIGLDLFSVLCK